MHPPEEYATATDVAVVYKWPTMNELALKWI